MNVHEVSRGIANKTMVHPREVFRPAILDGAVSIILCHNHPSGKLEPSSEDISITRKLKEAGEIIGIPVFDHIIISRKGHVSLEATIGL